MSTNFVISYYCEHQKVQEHKNHEQSSKCALKYNLIFIYVHIFCNRYINLKLFKTYSPMTLLTLLILD